MARRPCPQTETFSTDGDSTLARRYRRRHRGTVRRRKGTSDTAADLRAHFGRSAFTTAQAEQIGVTARRLAAAADAGVILRMRRGLYLVPDTATHPATTTSKAVPAHPVTSPVIPAGMADPTHLVVAHHRVSDWRERGVEAAVGDEAAASVWQLPHSPITEATIRVPRESTVHIGRRNGMRVRSGDVGDVVLFRGHAVTSPLATARDLSVGLPRHQAVALFGLAQRRQAEWLLVGDARMDPGDLTRALTDVDLRAALGQQMRNALHGSSRRQHWCDSADPRAESYLEGISWGRFTGWRLGSMTPQVWVRGASGRHYRVDVLINGIAGEADGAVKYGSPDALWKEKLRQEDIENGGTPVVRWTFAEAEHRPEVLLTRWRNALRRHVV